MDSHHIIERPLHTEKSVFDMQSENAYHFRVHKNATKTQIRHAIEDLFPGRRVIAVRTQWVKGKTRRVKYNIAPAKPWKKAIVKLRQGDSIDIGY